MAGEGLEQAAQAFDVAIGNSSGEPVARGGDAPKDTQPTETMFGDVGVLEVDEDSPAVGGGDDIPLKGEKKVKQPVQEEDEDDDDDAGEDDPEADDDGAEDENDGGEEDEDEDTPLNDVFEITVDGERQEVTLREALDGYIRQKTFHQRLSELAEVKEAMRHQGAELIADRKKYVGLIEQMEQTINLLLPNEPNWDELYANDPKGARELQKKYDGLKAQLSNLDGEKKRVQEENAKKDAEEYAAYVERENRRIAANNPLWKDEKVKMRDLNRMADTAKAAGFSMDEIQSVVDSRMVTILLKAAKYDRLQEKQPKPIRRGKKPMSQGAGTTRTAPRGKSQAMKQLQRSGSVEAAAAVFSDIIAPRR